MMYKEHHVEICLSDKQAYSGANESTEVQVPLLLWVNLMKIPGPSPLSYQFERFFDIHVLYPGNKQFSKQPKENPDFICFEYDYPDCQSLNLLKETRTQYPHIPIIMFTLQHSEDLAIWALRNRVWDYYYKPISKSCINEISREIVSSLSNARFKERREQQRSINSTYPNEVRFRRAEDRHAIIDTALNYLNSNYSHKFGEQEVADLCHLSRFQFGRLFKKVVGKTFQNYLLEYRIDKAKELLNNPNAKIVDIAYSVGFTDPAYFTRVFKRLVGTSPSTYRPTH